MAHGCWCYFSNSQGKGKGKPIDFLDEMCKVLHDGYECAMRDAEEEGTTCIPWEVNYTAALGNDINLTIAEECYQLNLGNNCAIRACSIEGNFIRNLLEVFVSGEGVDENLKHENGFDVQEKCVVKKSSGTNAANTATPNTEKSCCGTYPDRFPYKTGGGERQCCGYRTFNSLTLKCCDSESSIVKFNC